MTPEKSDISLIKEDSNNPVDPQTSAHILQEAGLTETEIEKITRHYGKRLQKILDWDPYDMVENVWKLSFFTADKIGKYLNIQNDDPRRIRGAILTAIKLFAEEGNMFAREEETITTAARIAKINPDLVPQQIEELEKEGRIVRKDEALYLPVYFKAEQEAAKKLGEILRAPAINEEGYQLPATDIEGHPFSEDQIKAIRTVVKNNITVITGGPGTGKTTTLRGILKLLLDADKKVVLTAPTGRAVKRMSMLTGGEATTIHRLLGYTMGRGYRNKTLDADVLIIDEASMLEQVLFNHLLQAVSPGTKIILVGDTDQLPPIGAGSVLKDMIESGVVPVIDLKENFRQGEGSGISDSALEIKKGNVPDIHPTQDMIIIKEDKPEDIHQRLLSLLKEEIPSYTGISPKNIQVVTPQKEGQLGARALNKELQELLNPDSPEIKRGMKKFRLGDRVMQSSNSSRRGVFNGEAGWISDIDLENKKFEVTFNDGKKSTYRDVDMKELSLAYATTVHKLQGSETDYMVFLLTSAHKNMLYRNLLYTAVSRAKKLCVIITEPEAMQTAVKDATRTDRNSNFSSLLREVAEDIESN